MQGGTAKRMCTGSPDGAGNFQSKQEPGHSYLIPSPLDVVVPVVVPPLRVASPLVLRLANAICS